MQDAHKEGGREGKRLPRGPGPHPVLPHRGLTWAWCQPSPSRGFFVFVKTFFIYKGWRLLSPPGVPVGRNC